MQKVTQQAKSLHAAVKHFVAEKLKHTDDIFIHGEFMYSGISNSFQPLFRFSDRKEQTSTGKETVITTIEARDKEAWSLYFRTLVPLLQEEDIRLSFVVRDAHGTNETVLIPQVPSSGNTIPSPMAPVEMEGMYETSGGLRYTGAVFVLYWHSRKPGVSA